MTKRRLNSDDVPELGDDFFANAKPLPDGPEELSKVMRAEAARRRRGAQKAPTKTLISLRLTRSVVEAYRRTGRGWQARMDADLEKAARRLPPQSVNRRI